MKIFSADHLSVIVVAILMGMFYSLFDELRGFDWAVLYLLTHALFEKHTN